MADNSQAPDIGDILGASGACPEITLGSKTYKIGWPTQAAKTHLRKLLTAAAAANLMDDEDAYPAPVFQRMFTNYVRRVESGDYKTWNPGWQAAISTHRGGLAFLTSLLKENHPEVTEAVAGSLYKHRPNEVRLALAQVAPPFFFLLLDDYPGMETAENPGEIKKQLLPTILDAFLRVLTPSAPTEVPSSTP